MVTLNILQTIPKSIDPASFGANLYLSKHECDFMVKLFKEGIAQAKKFHRIFWFIDDLWALNDGGEFQKSYEEIYPKELVLKLEHLALTLFFLIWRSL